jgi:hypothetical protein
LRNAFVGGSQLRYFCVMRGQVLTDTELPLKLVGEAYAIEYLAQHGYGILEIIRRAVPVRSSGVQRNHPG